jgi:DNA-binding IscR family transcriptional regulator
MNINSKFSVAVHTLLLIATYDEGLTSTVIAGSVNTNPVVIRRIIGQLQKSHLIAGQQGKAGYIFLKKLDEISLLDIYYAVLMNDNKQLFDMHDNPNIECPVGATIQILLETILLEAQEVMESVLKRVSIEMLVDKMKKIQENS